MYDFLSSVGHKRWHFERCAGCSFPCSYMEDFQASKGTQKHHERIIKCYIPDAFMLYDSFVRRTDQNSLIFPSSELLTIVTRSSNSITLYHLNQFCELNQWIHSKVLNLFSFFVHKSGITASLILHLNFSHDFTELSYYWFGCTLVYSTCRVY